MISCDEIQEILSAYLDGEERHDEVVVVRGHLESCEGCRALLADWEEIDALVSAATAPPSGWHARQAPGTVAPRAERGILTALAAAAALSLMAGTVVYSALGSCGLAPRQPAATQPGGGAVQPEGAGAGEQRNSRVEDGDLSLLIGLMSNAVPSGTPVRTRVQLSNVTDRPVTFLAPVESAIDVVVTKDGSRMTYRRSLAEGWSGELIERTLDPGQAIAEEVVFPAPPPGRYQLVAGCDCERSHPQLPPEEGPYGGSIQSRDAAGAPFSSSPTSAKADLLRTPAIGLTAAGPA